MPRPTSVEFEFERDGAVVVLSVRSAEGNFVLTLPIDGASVFAISAQRAAEDEAANARFRFQIQRAKLEVSK
jgi:hypothetical protein